MDAARVFHNFYYTSKNDMLVKLHLGADEQKALKTLLAGEMKEIDEEKYWLSFGRFMITHAPKAYLAWEGKSYWLVQLDKVNDDHTYDKKTFGIHIFAFTKNKIRYRFHETKKDQKEPDAFYSLIFSWWDWELEGEGEEDQQKMTPAEKKVLEENVDWTNEVHERMQKKHPPEKIWKK